MTVSDTTTDKISCVKDLRATHKPHTVEIWLPIPHWPYAISSLGRIQRSGKAMGARIGRIVQGGKANGYPVVQLKEGARRRWVAKHILAAEVFLGPRPAGMELHHKDHNRTNPAADNLEYVTSSQNKLHAVANGYHGARRYNAKLTPDLVVQIREMKANGKTVKGIAEEFSVSESAVHHVVSGRNWRQA